MIFTELRKKEGHVSGLVALERVIPSSVRSKAKELLMLVAPFVLMVVLFFEEQTYIPVEVVYSLMLLVAALWLIIFMLDCFYYSHYFIGAHFSIKEWGISHQENSVPYEILEIVSETHSTDLTGGFLTSVTGRDIFERLDIAPKDLEHFFLSDRRRFFADPVFFPDPVVLTSYVSKIYDTDPSFRDFLLSFGVKREELVGAASWVSAIYERKKEMHRWWGRDSLGRIRGVGKEWSRRETALLEQYGNYATPETDEILFKKEIDKLEQTLVRSDGEDALLIVTDPNEFKSIVSGLAGRIRDGSVLPQIEHKKLLILDQNKIANASVVEGQFETLVVRLLNQAVKAGHIILVIPDLPAFVSVAKKHHVDVVELLSPFLSSRDLQVVAFTFKDSYNNSLKNYTELVNHFEKIFVENEGGAVAIRALEHKVYETERLTHLFFTYQALLAIVDSANVNISTTKMENWVLKTFDELVPRLVQRRVRKVTFSVINELLSLKTGRVIESKTSGV